MKSDETLEKKNMVSVFVINFSQYFDNIIFAGHRYNKPNLSYVAILGIIIQNSQTGFLSLKEIYKSLGNFHPYFLGKYEVHFYLRM